jgi:outer membrane protein assembly factor BamB
MAPDFRLRGRLSTAWWLSWLLILATAITVAAQGRSAPTTQPSAYWRYDAPGPLQLVTTADLNGNGMEEFVVTTEEGQLIVVGADGRDRWSYETRDRAPIRQVATLNVDGATEPMREVLVATDSTLVLLDHTGQVLWRKAIEAAGATPAILHAYDADGDGSDGFLLALSNGLLRLYDGSGEQVWQFPETAPGSEEPQPQLAVGDIDGDGRDEIAYSYFADYSRLALLRGSRQPIMARSLSGQVTALAMPALGPTAIVFSPLARASATGTTFSSTTRRGRCSGYARQTSRSPVWSAPAYRRGRLCSSVRVWERSPLTMPPGSVSGASSPRRRPRR